MKILAIDNDIAVLDQLSLHLSQLISGCEIIRITDPAYAVKLMLNKPSSIECIFVSLLAMPLDGLQLLERAKEFMPCTPVIITTSSFNDEMQSLFRLRGASGSILKPFTLESVSKALAILDEYFMESS